MSSGTMAIQFVRAALETARANGIDLAGPLTEVINPALISHDLARVTSDQVVQMAQLLWHHTDDELFGLAPRSIPRGTFQMVTLGVIHTPDLRTALARLGEFIRISTGVPTRLVDEPDTHLARFEIDMDFAARLDPVIVDIGLAVIHRFASWLITHQIRLHSVELPYPETPYDGDYPTVFGIRPSFGARRTALSFDNRYLQMPIVHTDSELKQFIRNFPADIFARREYVASTAHRVRRILERNQGGPWLSADKVAARLCLSPQHLRRRLSAEDTTFRLIQEQILRDRAIESLTRGDETIDALATRLGYSEPSAFRRAFRRWTGTPPGAYIATTDHLDH
ncbi:AraC family transcriptional regulator [Mycolicibacterium aubagnense]|uniref:AraC family transcriptional regulator n=1 Tax=Mycolicibacterium aubagnense TaxID=319707 RepID=UPI00244DA0B0|nr:AraC family transcriptional regulator [Mycolicibacterium aubagnense]WGI31227.1 AraC family transcriptional regulator [Mycolicibacterium aubagnense]